MRGRSFVGLALLAAPATSCFLVSPLPDCADQGGLYLAYHVCMPRFREPIEIAGEPQELVVGNLDGAGPDDDVAVLVDPGEIQIYMDLASDTPTTVVLPYEAATPIEGILAARFLKGSTGDDLIAWVVPEYPELSDLFVVPNTGGTFSGAPVSDTLAGCPLDDLLCVGEPCYAPERALALQSPMSGVDEVLVFGCVPDAVVMGGPLGDAASKLPDALIVLGPTTPTPLKLTIDDETIRFVGAAQVVYFEPVDLGAFVFSHRPTPMDDAMISFVDLDTLEKSGPTIEPGHKGIDDLQSADFDDDGDLDLLALHIEEKGFSIIRQEESPGSGKVAFGEPEFYTLGVDSTAVALADFTGDGVLDIAVGHSVDNETKDAISVFVLDPGDATGNKPYASAKIGRVTGTVVGMKVMDLDGDANTDLAVSVRDGSKGRVEFFVNRPLGEPQAE